MRSRVSVIGPTSLALFCMALAMPALAVVYKWVDENGRAHYTDKPPKQGEHTQLRTQDAPVIPQNESVQSDPVLSEEESNLRGREWYRKQMEQKARFEKSRDEKIRVEQEKFKAEQKAVQKRQEDMMTASTAQNDELVAECKRNREVYCDKGVDKIRTEQELRRIEQEEDRMRARRNPVIPRYTGNDIYIR